MRTSTWNGPTTIPARLRLNERFLIDTNVYPEYNRAWILMSRRQALAETTDRLSQTLVERRSHWRNQEGIEFLLAGGKRRSQLEQWLTEDLESAAFSGGSFLWTAASLDRWASLLAQGVRAGKTFANHGFPDCALVLSVHSLTLVTRNVRDFQDLGVTLLIPWEAVRVICRTRS